MPHDLDELADTFADLREGEERPQSESEKKALDNETQIRRAFEMVASSKHGAAVLRRILDLTGYQAPLCVRSATGFDAQSTLHNIAKRDFWIEIRGYLKPETLSKIENSTGD